MRSSVVVVGAGFGGLSAAIALRAAGVDVVVVERASVPGGKARSIEVGGRPIDVGPTVLTMRWVFDELCASVGRSLEDVVRVTSSDVVARHSFADDTTLDLYSDLERSIDAVGRLAGAGEARAYASFAAHCARIAEIVRTPFLGSERPSLTSLMKTGLPALARIDAHRSMWRAIRSFFSDPRLVALFARYATYVGSSPFDAPATLNLIAHVEREGVALVDGGISALARALAGVAAELGVVFRYGCTARHIAVERGRVSGVVVEQDGARDVLAADAVVANVDVATLAWGALGPAAASAVARPDPRKRSLSALTWAIEGRATGFDLERHNVFFARDYASEHKALFDERRVPVDPTVYLCAQDRGVRERSIDEGESESERFFVIVNAPAVADEAPLESEELQRCERAMFERLSKAGLTLTPSAMTIATPASFEQLAPGTGGAIYGDTCHGSFAPLTRPTSRTKLRGLHLAGGSVHPGPGVPMAALSGRLAARTVLSDLASTRTSRVWVTAGSTSTP